MTSIVKQAKVIELIEKLLRHFRQRFNAIFLNLNFKSHLRSIVILQPDLTQKSRYSSFIYHQLNKQKIQRKLLINKCKFLLLYISTI